MSMTNKISISRVFCDSVVLVGWPVSIAMLGIYLGFKELWATFFCVIMFAIYQKNTKKIPEILCGAVVGVWLAWGMVMLIQCVKPIAGDFWSTYGVLFLGVYLIAVGGVLMPMFVNITAFVYLTAALSTGVSSAPLEATQLIIFGGGLVLFGDLVLMRLLAKIKWRELV